ncbi:3-oxoadipate enol-lactonase [Pseudomonas syringae]|uniref:3-oxoadipate enol-lactonase n=1 Tax=Pseudomonas syringae TaxID=317 RepID=A0A1C7Z684_PSESX|nr:3-oxoadipate enol-lactonase [Pseudomonas syringae]OCR24467.1 3-oxoadipate enol-lactonase [Pseudomonas syringae]
MPTISLPDGDLYYQLDGPQSAPVVLLSNSLGTHLGMWDAQIPALAEHFRVLRYDTRGHGQSLVSAGLYTIEQNGHDVLALLDALDIRQADFCGLSMGGLIGQWLMLNAPQRLRRVVLCNTAAKIASPEVWNPRIEAVLRDGTAAMHALRDATVSRWFTPRFAEAEPEQVTRMVDMLANTSPAGYAANCAAVRDADYREQIATVRLPVLVICGDQDPVTSTADGQFLVDAIEGAQLLELSAAHLSNVEASQAFSAGVLDFLLS